MLLANRLKAKPSHAAIEVIKNYGDLPAVECYPGQLNQVFMNIIANAIDAIEQHIARTENKQSPHSITIQTQVRSKDGAIEIKIKDDGPGMPKDICNNIFDPFYTTKPTGKGTGLGLSISYQIIVERHKGTIRCHSIEGQGTEFIIVIPNRQN
jgi:signal transduction histidine kinase